MIAIATFLVVATLSLLFTRLVTGALIATGMPPEVAAFQARSAFTGAGFTTSEAENVVNHPARRKLISTAMFSGNLGVPTLLVTVMLGLLAPGPGDTSTRIFVLAAGAAVLVAIASTRPVTRYFVELGRRKSDPMVRRAIQDRGTALLQLGADFEVVALPLRADLTLRSLRGLQFALPTVKVLGVRPGGRSDAFLTGPPLDLELSTGDEVVVLARRSELAEIVGEVSGPARDGQVEEP